MNKLQYTIAAVCLLCPSLLVAQINDVVEVENSYVPIIRDANKINLTPNKVEQPAVHYQVDYIKTPFTAQSYVFQPLWAAKSDAITEGEGKGYAHVGYGSHGNLTGRVSYGADLTTDDRIDLSIGIDGYNGKVKDYLDNTDWTSRFYQSDINLSYLHRLSPVSSLILEGSIEGQAYNYQRFAPNTFSGGPQTDKQRNLITDVSARITPYSFGQFALGGSLGYQGFKQMHNEWLTTPDAENIFHAGVNGAYELNDDQKIGLDLGLKYEAYNRDADNYFSYWGSPYYSLMNDQWNVKLGLTLSASSGFVSKFHIAPDVTAVFHAADNIDLKAQLIGGEHSNDFRVLNALSPYWCTDATSPMVAAFPAATYTLPIPTGVQFAHQFDQLDSKFGIEWKAAEQFILSAAIGFDMHDNRLEMISDAETNPTSTSTTANASPYLYHHFFTADGNRFYGELNMAYRYKDIVDVKLNNKVNSWGTDADWIGALRPVFDADWSANVKIIPGLVGTLDFVLQTYDNDDQSDYKRPNRYDLGLGLSYQIPVDLARITVFARGNNLLNNKFDLYNAYKAPGINFVAGAAVTF